jgi:hypothetical protein
MEPLKYCKNDETHESSIENAHGEIVALLTTRSNEDNDRLGTLFSAALELLESLDPETLEAIADEMNSHTHSARATSLRGIAKRQRIAALLATAPQPTPAETTTHG